MPIPMGRKRERVIRGGREEGREGRIRVFLFLSPFSTLQLKLHAPIFSVSLLFLSLSLSFFSLSLSLFLSFSLSFSLSLSAFTQTGVVDGLNLVLQVGLLGGGSL